MKPYKKLLDEDVSERERLISRDPMKRIMKRRD